MRVEKTFQIKALFLSVQPAEGVHSETNAERPSFDAFFIATDDASRAVLAFLVHKFTDKLVLGLK